jgi:hypothetical protein
VTVKFKYIGSGEFFIGIPARDLMEEDWERLDEEQQKMVTASQIYKKAEALASNAKAAKEEEDSK